MTTKSAKAKEIEIYIENGDQVEIGRWPIELGGQKNVLTFYKFPISLYRFKGYWTQGQIHLWRLFASLIRLYTHNLQVLLTT